MEDMIRFEKGPARLAGTDTASFYLTIIPYSSHPQELAPPIKVGTTIGLLETLMDCHLHHSSLTTLRVRICCNYCKHRSTCYIMKRSAQIPGLKKCEMGTLLERNDSSFAGS